MLVQSNLNDVSAAAAGAGAAAKGRMDAARRGILLYNAIWEVLLPADRNTKEVLSKAAIICRTSHHLICIGNFASRLRGC